MGNTNLSNLHEHLAPLIISHTMDPLLETNRKKVSKYQLKFYKEPQAITPMRKKKTEKYHSYVKYISTPLCGVSATQSSIQRTVIAENENDMMPGVAEPDGNDWIGEGDNEPALDQAYLDLINDSEHLIRERPKGVSTNQSQALHDIEKLTVAHRMRPFDNGNYTVINF